MKCFVRVAVLVLASAATSDRGGELRLLESEVRENPRRSSSIPVETDDDGVIGSSPGGGDVSAAPAGSQQSG